MLHLHVKFSKMFTSSGEFIFYFWRGAPTDPLQGSYSVTIYVFFLTSCEFAGMCIKWCGIFF